MVDVNLLPEEIRKKDDKLAKSKKDFDLNEIEFSSGHKLQRENSGNVPSNTKSFADWVKSKTANSFTLSDNKNSGIQEMKSRPNFTRDIEDKNEEIKIVEDNNKKSFFSKIFTNKNNDNYKPLEEREINSLKNKNLKPDSGGPKINIEIDTAKKPPEKTIVYDSSNIEKKKIQNNARELNQRQVPRKSEINFKDTLKKLAVLFKSKKPENQKRQTEPNVNLLPSEIKEVDTNTFIFSLLLSLLMCVLIVFAVYFGVSIYRDKIIRENNELNKTVNDSLEDLKSYDSTIKDIESWQEKVQKIQDLFGRHIYWSKFFKAIEDNTLPTVNFSNFQGGLNGNLVLSAMAPDYQTVVRQWLYLKRANNFAKNVIITGASLSEDGVSFSITLDLQDNIFYDSSFNLSSTTKE